MHGRAAAMGKVNYFCEAPQLRHKFELGAVTGRMLLLDCRFERTAALPSAVLEREGFRAKDYELTVLRGGPGFSDVIKQDAALARRFKDHPVLLVEGSTDPTSRTPRLTVPGWAGPTYRGRPALRTLREVETWALVGGRGGLLSADNRHFEVRSGDHVEEYIRVRNVLDDALDAERLADWLLEGIAPDCVVLGDRPELLPLVQAVALSALRRFGWDLTVDTLDRYPRLTRSSAELMRQVRAINPEVLGVLAVDTNASMEAEFRLLGPRSMRVATLVDVSVRRRKTTDSFAHHAIRRHRHEPGMRCPLCASGVELVRVDPQFEDLIEPKVREPRKVSLTALKSRRSFWAAVESSGALQLHHEVTYDHHLSEARQRHRPIAFDVPALLRDKWFSGQFRTALRAGPTPDAVIIPDHEATADLADVVGEALGLSGDRQVHVVPRGRLTTPVRRRLRQYGQLLIVDDALVTGNTLIATAEEIHGTAGSEVSLAAAIAVASPSRSETLRRVASALANSIEPETQPLRTAQTLLVPADDECPFCEERRWWEGVRTAVDAAHGHVVERRIHALDRPVDASALLLVDSKEARVSSSHLGDLSADVAFAAVACEAHKLLDEIRGDWPPTAYLDTAHILGSHRHAPFVAGALRVMSETEMNYSRSTRDVIAAIREAEKLHPSTSAELAWAIIMDKLPIRVCEVLLPHVEEQGKRHEMLGVLGGLLREKARMVVASP